MEYFLIGFGGAILLILTFLLLPLMVRRSQPPGVVAAPAPAPANPAPPAVVAPPATTTWWRRPRVAIGAIGLVVLLGILLYLFGNKLPTVTGGTLTGAGGVLTTLVLLALGVLLLLKGGAVGKWFGLAIIVLTLLFGERALEAVRTSQQKVSGVVLDDKPLFTPSSGTPPTSSAASVPPRATVVAKEAIWTRREGDGTIPVNVWSETIEKPQGCEFGFDLEEGRRAEYQNYSTRWKPWTKGMRQNVTAIRFQVTEPGITKVPYWTHC